MKGIILEYQRGGETETRAIDLLNLNNQFVKILIIDCSLRTDAKALAKKIVENEPLISDKREEQVAGIIEKLKGKISQPDKKQFTEVKVPFIKDFRTI